MARMGNELLGPHVGIVQDICSRIEALRAGGPPNGPRVILLRGPAGVGKSRIVREVYERLAGQSQSPRYWPPLPEIGDRILTERKVLAPPRETMHWAERALPEFAWWELSSEETSSGLLRDGASSLNAQLLMHAVPLAAAKLQHTGALQRLGSAATGVFDRVRDVFVNEGADFAIEALLDAVGLFVPVPRALLDLTVDAAKGLGTGHRRRADVKLDVDLGAQHNERQRTLTAETADALREAATPELPGIVVAEDLHFMSGDAAQLLDRLLVPDSEHPTLLIGTVWPEAEATGPYAEWLAGQLPGVVAVVDVPLLGTDDLIALVRQRAEHTDEAVARQVGERLQVPLAVEMFLTEGKAKRDIRRNNGRLTEAEITGLPDGLEGLYEDRWKQLPEPTRWALACAVATEPLGDPFARFPVSAIISVLRETLDDQVADAEGSLRYAIDLSGWCLDQDGVQLFTEHLLTLRASRFVGGAFSEADIAEFRTIARREMVEAIDRDRVLLSLPDTKLATLMCRWYLSLTTAEDPNLVDATALWRRAEEEAARGSLGTAATTAHRALEVAGGHLDLRDTLLIDLRHRAAVWLGDSGQALRARGLLVAMFQEVVERSEPGRLHPITMDLRADIARFTGLADDPEGAVNLLHEQLEQQAAFYGPVSRAVFTTQIDQLEWRARFDPVVAIVRAQGLLMDLYEPHGGRDARFHEPHNGRFHDLGLRVLRFIAGQHLAAGNVDAASEFFGRLLDEQLRIYGENSDEALDTRLNLAINTQNSGDYAGAVAAFTSVIESYEARLGSRAPQTMAARSYLAILICAEVDLDQGLPMLKELMVDQSEVLGPTHPDTFDSRFRHAMFTSQLGRNRECIDLLEQLLAELENARNATHSHIDFTKLLLREALQRGDAPSA